MDDRESPTNDLHLNLQDVHTDIQEERIKSCLASSPDENENQCNSRKSNTLKNSHNTMGRVEQDSINNNEDSGDYSSCFQEDESDRACKSLKSDMPQKLGPEKKNPRKTKSPSRKGEFKQMDSNVLPLFLHQIAETYFQDGEYEKAMKFIRLEQLYHKQLLANLSSLQQQWETKWKATERSEVPNLKNSSKELNNEELDKLAEFCTSHQEPLVSRSKLINKEISFRCERFISLMASDDLKEQITSTSDSETLDTPFSQCLSLRDARENDSLQLRKEQFSLDGAKIEAAAEKPAATCFSEPMVDAFVWTDADYIPPDLIATDENIPSERNLWRTKSCSSSVVIASSQLESNLVNQPQQQQPDYENNRKSVQSQPSDISGNAQFDTEMSKQPRVVYEWIQEETTVLEEKGESVESEGFFEQILNGTIKVREGALKFLEAQENSEILPHIPLEQALYSSSEDFSPDESFSSLDELAKRIQIAETVPAEGLISILKKRDDNEEKTLAQIQLRQSKRRVRFQEMEDTLEQEDVGAGSCILLILLCIATVFLSIGGTALYCTLGNTKSAVCTDFAANVDFYHSQIQKGIEELRHWITL